MDYRLGLDLGTKSVGAVALALDEHGNPTDIAWDRVHIFSEPASKDSKGNYTPKAKARREARMPRRLRYRRKRALKRILHLAPLLGIENGVPKINQMVRYRGQNIPKLYLLRAKAAEEQITLEEMLAVFVHLIKRRGYYGGFQVKSETGKVETGANKLHAAMNGKTVGQYKLERLLNNLPAKLKVGDADDAENLYALRDDIQHEFNTIWDEQAKYYKVLNQNKKSFKSSEIEPLKTIFFEAIFDQRPLKSVAPMVGNCSLQVDLPRAPLAQMAAQ